MKKTLKFIWGKLSERFSGFTLDLVYKNGKIPEGFLNKINAKMLDDAVEMRLRKEDFVRKGNRNAVKEVGITDFETLASLHDQLNPEMYWTSERILKDWNRWRVFQTKLNKKKFGYTMSMIYTNHIHYLEEVFVLEGHESVLEELLEVVCETAFVNQKCEVLYMLEREDLALKKVPALALGFRETGSYQLWRAEV